MGPEYLIAAVASVVLTVVAELLVLRTGLFRRRAYWLTMAVLFAFQVPVDGWLTKLSDPIVLYAPAAISGLRVPWDIPVEDYLFGFSLLTTTLLLWERHRRADRPT
ncbi:lycopene cyclase domain-containing protein [Actinosynnema sp. NPDC004786]